MTLRGVGHSRRQSGAGHEWALHTTQGYTLSVSDQFGKARTPRWNPGAAAACSWR